MLSLSVILVKSLSAHDNAKFGNRSSIIDNFSYVVLQKNAFSQIV